MASGALEGDGARYCACQMESSIMYHGDAVLFAGRNYRE